MHRKAPSFDAPSEVHFEAGGATLEGDLEVPDGAQGIVVFAHGSGSSRFSPRNRHVARALREAGLATLLVDLLTKDEEAVDELTGQLRFDIAFLAHRLAAARDWLAGQPRCRDLQIGYFGASTGGGAALVAAADRPERVGAIVSRGGRPDLAGAALRLVRAPTLLLVGGNDHPVIRLNEAALAQLGSTVKELVIVPGASHLFEEPGTLDLVAQHAAAWFNRHLSARRAETAALM